MGVNESPNGRKRRWTDAEKRYLVAHREDGAHLIAICLHRTPKSVARQAERMHVSLERHVGEVCPVCGEFHLRGNRAGRHGMCQTCWNKQKAAALAEKKLTELEQTQLGQAEIRERVLTGRTEGNTFLVEAHYLVLEDAALERQFEVNQ